MPALSRRALLAGLPAALLAPWTLAAAAPARPTFVSAADVERDRHSLQWLDQSGRRQSLHTDFRGHATIQHPRHPERVLLFGRRPSTQCLEVDLSGRRAPRSFAATAQRHFYGHGCFSADGERLFTTENDYRRQRGVIGVRDARTLAHLGEFDCHGIGPHQIGLMPDGRTLAVAIGGILTHPDSGRQKLNLERMRSSLTYLDSDSGALLERRGVTEPKASIRHLDIHPDGSVALAMQLQRDAAAHARPAPLAATHRRGEPIRLLQAPPELLGELHDYLGSVAVNHRHRVVGCTSPRGNLAAFWRLDDGALLGHYRFFDVCGIANSLDGRHFVLSSSNGQLRQLASDTLRENRDARLRVAGVRWDNHLSLASASW